jgi:simple sugar transport system substrate-binding protein
MMKNIRILWAALIALAVILVFGACTQPGAATQDEADNAAEPAEGDNTGEPAEGVTEEAGEELVFGMILVGPKDDRGWSQAHFAAGQYVEQNVANSRMIVFEKLNPGDTPEATVEGVVDDMVEQGARLIFLTSDVFEEDAVGAAEKYPDVTFIMVSGDDAWEEGKNEGNAPANMGNVMGRMEDMKAIAGCAAALSTDTGSIGYLGPLINDETRRLAASAYLGARHCWETYRGEDAADLRFEVKWIGFWFHIPGTTADPTEVTNTFFDQGTDVVLSGIDTTQAIVVAGQRAAEGDRVFAIPYDFEGACEEAPDVCLGVPYFNWGPSYVRIAQDVIGGTWEQDFEWLPANWENLTDNATTAVGWVNGPALTADVQANLDDFISQMAGGEVNVWTGPLNLQDGTEYVPAGQEATDFQIWYLPQLLEGMEGPSE